MQLSFDYPGDRARGGKVHPEPWETLDDVDRTEVIGALAKLMVKTAGAETTDDER